MGFYSVTVTKSESKWTGYSTRTKTTFNMNEVIHHGENTEISWGTRDIILIILGTVAGIISSPIIFNKKFPSFLFFVFVLVGAVVGVFIGAVIAAFVDDVSGYESKWDRQAKVERRQIGYSEKYAIVKEEDWESFTRHLEP